MVPIIRLYGSTFGLASIRSSNLILCIRAIKYKVSPALTVCVFGFGAGAGAGVEFDAGI